MRIALLLVLLAVLPATAQTAPDTFGWVSVQVTNIYTGRPLLGANVYVENTYWGVCTDTAGRFLLRVPAGSHRLTASYIGYRSVTVQVEIVAADTVFQDFELEGGHRQQIEAIHWCRFDSIKPFLDTLIFDATLINEHLARDTPTVSELELADSVRLRALRTWRSHKGRYFARILRIPAEGDTQALHYLLIEDGDATYVRFASEFISPRVLHLKGCTVVRDAISLSGWCDWNGQPLDRPGRLQLLMWDGSSDPDSPYRF